jgi:hypothetical protein
VDVVTMSDKLACPGCNTYTSQRLRELAEGKPCSNCGLSADATAEILAVRRVQADENLKAQLEDALIRLGKAETERDALGRRLERIRWAFEDADGEIIGYQAGGVTYSPGDVLIIRREEPS